MLDRVLVPLDGSALSEGVLPYVEALAGKGSTTVVLLHVVDPETLERKDPKQVPYLDQLVSRAEVRARDYLRRLAERMRPTVPGVATRLLLGLAPEQIVDYAQAEGCNLIAMSTHGRSGVGRWVFGSVADRVLHLTRTPLLLVRPPDGDGSVPPVRLQRLLVPLDGSELAEKAIPYAVELAHRLDLTTEVVRVLQYQMGAGFGLYVEDPGDLLQKYAEENLARVQEGLRHEGLRAKATLLWGSAGGRIVDAAQAEPGTLVLLSSHGRSGAERWVLGSTADKVIRAVGLPVLVIRPAAMRTLQGNGADPARERQRVSPRR